MKAELLIDSACLLGEGPVWDERDGTLWWVDIEGKRLHRYQTSQASHESYALPERVGAFALREQGGLLMAGDNGWAFCDTDGSNWTPIADPEPNLPRHRFNDGKCDATGRFYAGTYMMENQPDAAFYVLQPDLTWQRLLDGIICSNGLTWSPDRQTMYYIDSPTKQVDRLDVDPATGLVQNRETVIRVPEAGVTPDGMTADVEGMLWVAEWGGGKVSRWNPHTGERLLTIEVPAKHVTSCVFGGENMDELFITTASLVLSEQERSEYPHAGGVFHARVGVKGLPSYRFAG